MNNDIILDEQDFLENNLDILSILLIDRTTKKNIIWGTNNYKRKGYFEKDNIPCECISGKYNPIKPRVHKSKTEQLKRSKDMAEVFTPSWVCNKQNNLIDEQWFGYFGVFNIEKDKSWLKTEKVEFKGKEWKQYVSDIRLEITCGEAPYLVSRYDTVSGEKIDLYSRIGLFDRKMRVIEENSIENNEWLTESLNALKSVYGYEWQGDNLFLARQNLFFSYIDYYYDHYKDLPSHDLLVEVATIISWNLWQMDGLKGVVPYSCTIEKTSFVNLFGEEIIEEYGCNGCNKGDIFQHNGKYSIIMDWEKNKKIKYIDLLRGGYRL